MEVDVPEFTCVFTPELNRAIKSEGRHHENISRFSSAVELVSRLVLEIKFHHVLNIIPFLAMDIHERLAQGYHVSVDHSTMHGRNRRVKAQDFAHDIVEILEGVQFVCGGHLLREVDEFLAKFSL